MTCGIYKIVNKRTGETYIGQSQNIEKRWKKHESDLRNNKHSNQRIQKDYDNGDSFLFTILEQTKFDKEELNSLEIEYIIGYNTFNEGYNQTPGGDYDKLKGQLDLGGGRLPIHKYKPIKEINRFQENNALENLENNGLINDLSTKNENLLELLMKNKDIEKEKEYLKESERYYNFQLETIAPSKINLNKLNYLIEKEEWVEALKICEDYLKIEYNNEINLIKKELESKPELEEALLINYLTEYTTNENIINKIKPLIKDKKILFKTEIDMEIKKIRRKNITHN